MDEGKLCGTFSRFFNQVFSLLPHQKRIDGRSKFCVENIEPHDPSECSCQLKKKKRKEKKIKKLDFFVRGHFVTAEFRELCDICRVFLSLLPPLRERIVCRGLRTG